MKAIPIQAVLDGIPKPHPFAPACAELQPVAPFQPGPASVQLGHLDGEGPWQRHPEGDALLQVLEGDVEISLLAVIGLVREPLPAGSLYVVPRGLWYRLEAKAASLLAVLPEKGESERSAYPLRVERSA